MGLNWEKDRRAALFRHGAKMQREENQAVDRVLARPRYRQAPASERQIDYLQDLRAKAGLPPLDKIDCLKLGKNDASDMIKSLTT